MIVEQAARPSVVHVTDRQDGGEPPYVLVVCALLWIGMAMDRYLPTLWLLAVESAMTVVAVAVLGVRAVRRLRR